MIKETLLWLKQTDVVPWYSTWSHLCMWSDKFYGNCMFSWFCNTDVDFQELVIIGQETLYTVTKQDIWRYGIIPSFYYIWFISTITKMLIKQDNITLYLKQTNWERDFDICIYPCTKHLYGWNGTIWRMIIFNTMHQSKRHKFGTELFKLCTDYGYTYEFSIYCGKELFCYK